MLHVGEGCWPLLGSGVMWRVVGFGNGQRGEDGCELLVYFSVCVCGLWRSMMRSLWDANGGGEAFLWLFCQSPLVKEWMGFYEVEWEREN